MKVKGIVIALAVIVCLPALVYAQGKEWGQNTKTFNQQQRVAKQAFMKSPTKPTNEQKKQFSQERKNAKVAFRAGGRVLDGGGGGGVGD